MHPCAGRSKRSREVFEEIAIGNDRGHSPRITYGLMTAGLIVGHTKIVGINGFGPRVKITAYEVPPAIHAQWCQWCAEQRGADNAG